MENYKGYTIDKNPYSIPNHPADKFMFSNDKDCEEAIGTAESIENCKAQIDEITLDRNEKQKVKEAIKARWVDLIGAEKYEKIKGYINNTNGWNFDDDFDPENKEDYDVHTYRDGEFWEFEITHYRPKSLDGIENNRGWVIIETESDFPTEHCYMEIANMNAMEPIRQWFHHFVKGDEKYLIGKGATHFKLHPFNPPIV